jgi:hypothetical protein
MNYTKLKDEITNDPEGIGYAGKTDQEVVDLLNVVNRERNRTSMTGSEILNAVATADWAGRTDAQKQVIWDICHLGSVNPFGVEATLMIDAFDGSTGATITALQAARKETISRATELGLGNVKTGYVQEARV